MTRLPARKSLGQHFLHDPAVIDRIVREIDPARDDFVVEIGGGTGTLTRRLLDRLDHLHVIETDRRLVPILAGLAPAGRLTLHAADALELDFEDLGDDTRKLRVVGNLPYNISTPLLFHFLRFKHRLRDLHVMLQKEVAERMVARPHTKRYGRLTVMLSAFTDIELCFEIGPGAFRPPPKVRSTLVRIVPRSKPKFTIHDQAAFERFVALAFSMRRKSMRRILSGRMTEADLVDAGFDPMSRPENLAPEDFARLAELTG